MRSKLRNTQLSNSETNNKSANSFKDLLKSSILKIQEKDRRIRELEGERDEPIAIIGMSCRFPGAPDPEAFWQLIKNGDDAVSVMTDQRWDMEDYFSSVAGEPGKINTRHFGLLDEVDQFDPSAFGISEAEAPYLDPQHRLLLEQAWFCFERAGFDIADVRGTDMGVFIGQMNSDYTRLIKSAVDLNAYVGQGNALSAAAGRLSYVFGLTGPSMSVDTACSSSLVTVHLACQSLRVGECSMALAGGVNLLLSPEAAIGASVAHMLSARGRCNTFGDAADGYVRAEGCGLVLLKTLAQAQTDGDKILAVIRGSAINQDGRSHGLNAPNGPAQMDVMRRALEHAQVSPSQVCYLETHGTGTSLGDPVEVQAIDEVYARVTDRCDALVLGAVKANIGHCESAAGIAGLIKLVLLVQDDISPPIAHLDKLNPHLDDLSEHLVFPRGQAQTWNSQQPRIAALSSFGYTGTNVHLILAQYPQTATVEREDSPTDLSRTESYPFCFSAHSGASLRRQLAQLAEHLSTTPNVSLEHLAASVNRIRNTFSYRFGVQADTLEALQSSLLSGAQREFADAPVKPSVVLCFSSSDSPLVTPASAFANALWSSRTRELQESLERVTGLTLETLSTCQDYPVLTRMIWQLLQAQRLVAEGAQPQKVQAVGTGTLAALVFAGVLGFEQAASLCLSLDQSSNNSVPEAKCQQLIDGLHFAEAQRQVHVGGHEVGEHVWYEWPHGRASEAKMRLAEILSNVKDQHALVWPLQQTERGIDLSQLQLLVQKQAQAEQSDKQSADPWVGLCVALFNQGVSLMQGIVEKGVKAYRQPLPDYPFERRRYWLPEQVTKRVASLPSMFSPVRHSVFTTVLAQPNGSSLFAGELSLARLPFLRDHVVAGDMVVPASLYLDMIAEVCTGPSGAPARVARMQIVQACVLDAGPVGVYCRVSSSEAATANVDIYTIADNDVWTKHVSASVDLYAQPALQAYSLAAEREVCPLPVAVDQHLARALQAGIEYGASFQAISELFRGPGVALAKIDWPASLPAQWSGRGLHPVLLDACFQVISGAIDNSADENERPPLFVPTEIHGVEDSGHRCNTLWCFVRILGPEPSWSSDEALQNYLRQRERFSVALHAYDEQGQAIITIERFEASRYQPTKARQPWEDWLLEKHWVALPSLSAGLTITGEALLAQAQPHFEAAKFTMNATVIKDLDALSGHYIRQAFSKLGLAKQTSVSNVDDALQRHAILPSYRRLVQRLLALSQALPAPRRSAKAIETRLRAKLGEETRELDLLLRCGDALADVLRGRIKAVDLLFEADNSQGTEALYQDSAGSLALNDRIAALVAQAVSCLPPGRRLRILEVGAGTGATTRQVLQQVRGQALDYVFTDLSEHFLTRAKDKFHGDAFMNYQIFDLHRDPCEQGFKAGQFDLIIAVNVLHATSDLTRTLDHLSLCLAEGGMLLLRELTQAQAWLDLSFGLTAGWWNFTDTPLRQNSPLLDTGRWQKLLRERGFESTLVTDEPGRTESIFIAKKVARLADQAKPEPKGCYVVFADDDVGAQMQWLTPLKQDLQTRGQSLMMICSDEALRNQRLESREDFAALLADIEETKGPITGVVYAWSLRPADLVEATLLDEAQLYLKYPLLLCQALLHSRWRHLSPSFLTAGAQPVQDKVTQPLQSMLWGHVFAYVNENATFARLIDLDPASVVGDILCEALAQTEECQLVIREGQLRAARLRRATLSVPEASSGVSQVSASASYLITGGFGDLGLQTAKKLAEQGARHLVLIGRGARKEAEQTLSELRELGVQVIPVYVDVSDEAALNTALKDVLAELPPLRGVVHSVGVLEDGVIEQQSWERYLRVLQPKVFGAIYLYRAVAACDLDFFVIYSSASAVMGNPGQANHAAANSFLDAFAWYLHGLQRPGLAIGWGAWSEIGAAAARDMTARLSSSDSIAGTISPEQGMALIAQQFACTNVQFTVLPLHHRQSLDSQQLPQVQRLLAELLDEAGTVTQAPSKVSNSVDRVRAEDFLRGLQQMSVPERRRRIETHLQEVLAKLLKHSGAIEPQVSLFDHGLDSLLVIDLRGLLEKRFAQKFESTLLYDYPSIGELTDFLLKRVPAKQPKVAPPAPVSAASPAPRGTGQYDGAIAVVGMSCRFPGGANSTQQFWDLLKDGVDTVKNVPAERWDHAKYYDPDRTQQGKIYVAEGCFVDQVDQFCPERFGIAGIEAELMDPQQRMLLDVCYEALEAAGQDPMALGGSETGVFMGVMTQDYLQLTQHVREHAFYVGTGNANSIVAGRISHAFGLMGPTMTLDTACSSSLVGVQLACANLRSGACDMALAGGVSLQLSPEPLVIECAGGMLSPTGRCRTFDASADGFVRGEGCGVVVLKRLADAEKDGDPIIGVIRGAAVTHDGRAGGLTVPNGLSQQRVLEKALQDAGVSPSEISYIEAHGTGTHLGDPMELNALQAVFGQSHSQTPLSVGSVKTNIGHAEAAAGIAGLIKVLLCLEHGKLVPHLHFENPNPNFDWEQGKIEVTNTLREWTSASPRRAGVSSFGLSGTNAHLVVEEYPASVPSQEPPAAFVPLSVLSHMSREQLQYDAARYVQALTECSMSVVDVAYTFCMSRAGQSFQAIVPAASMSALLEGLQALAQGKLAITDKRATAPQLHWRLAAATMPQWIDQSGAYYDQYEAFQRVIDESAEALRARGFDLASSRALCARECVEIPEALHLAILGLAYGRLLLSLGIEPEQVYAQGLMLLCAGALGGAASIETMLDGLLAKDESTLQTALSGLDFSRSHLPVTFEADTRIRDAFNRACSAACDNTDKRDPARDGNTQSGLSLDLLQACLGGQSCAALHQLLAALAQQGQKIHWKTYFAPAQARKVALPSSCFPTRRYWVQAQTVEALGSAALISNDITSAGDGHRYVAFDLDVAQQSFLAEHRLGSTKVLPAAGSLAFALHALASTNGVSIRGVRFLRPLQFDQQLSVQLEFSGDGRAQLYSRESATEPWQSFSSIDSLVVDQTMVMRSVPADTDALLTTLRSIRDGATFSVDKDAFYSTYIPKELHLGESYRRIEHMWRDGQSTVAKIRALSTDFAIDPRVLDTCLQSVNVLGETLGIEPGGFFLPSAIGRIELYNWPKGLYFWCLTQYLPACSRADELVYDITVVDEHEQLCARFEQVSFRKMTSFASETPAVLDKEILRHLVWKAVPLAEGNAVEALQNVLLIGRETPAQKCLQVTLQGEAHQLWCEDISGNAQQKIQAMLEAHNDVQAFIYTDLLDVLDADTLSPALWSEGCADALWSLAQWLIAASDHGVPMIVLTQSAQNVNSEEPLSSGTAFAAAALVQTAVQEFPSLHVVLVDIDESVGNAAFAPLWLAEIQTQTPEPVVAYRQGQRYQRTLAPIHTLQEIVERDAPPVIRSDRTYIISGGLGDIGLLTGEKLVAEGANALVLLTRSVRPETDERIAALRESGCQVQVLIGDVSDLDMLKNHMQTIARDMPPVAGILHAAGALSNALLKQQDEKQWYSVLDAKVKGALNLYELSTSMSLDFFVLFSSIASIGGSVGQANYAVANGLLDYLAQRWAQQGIPAMSINWGAWEDTGMARQAQRRGIEFEQRLSPEQALTSLSFLLRQPMAQVICYIDEQSPAPSETVSVETHKGSALDKDFYELTTDEQTLVVVQAIRDALMDFLKIDASQVLDDRPFFDFGMDSITAVDFSYRISEVFALELHVDTVFDYPSVITLAGHIMQLLRVDEQSEVPQEAMSIDDLSKMLELELGND